MKFDIMGGTEYRNAPAVLVTPRGADDHRGRMNAMRSIRIPLHSRKYPDLFAIVDESDGETIGRYRWNVLRASNTFYARANMKDVHGVWRVVYMHHLVLPLSAEKKVDHKNRNGLDNRRSNLRYSSTSQNTSNSGPRCDSASGFKGVFWCHQTQAWRSEIRPNGGYIYLGRFNTPEDAARAYDAAARKHFGEFAYLNFPEEGGAS